MATSIGAVILSDQQDCPTIFLSPLITQSNFAGQAFSLASSRLKGLRDKKIN
jgi:hypothetical protein